MTSGSADAWLTTPITADLVRGALELEPTALGLRPHRLPAWARAQVPDGQLAMAEAQPSGVRLVLRTSATALEVDVLPTRMAYRGASPRPDGVYDLLVDGVLVDQQTDAVDLPLPDDLHPDAATHRLIGERFAALASGADGAFSAATTVR